MGRELIELWREHDSTGLRAEAKLIPHRSRGARRPENIREFQRRFRDDTANYKGKPPGFPFFNGYGPSPWFEGGDDGLSRDACACGGRARSSGWTGNGRCRWWFVECPSDQAIALLRREPPVRQRAPECLGCLSFQKLPGLISPCLLNHNPGRKS